MAILSSSSCRPVVPNVPVAMLLQNMVLTFKKVELVSDKRLMFELNQIFFFALTKCVCKGKTVCVCRGTSWQINKTGYN